MRRRARTGAILTAVAATAAVIAMTAATMASAATMFTDDFADGNANDWSKSNGTWSVVADSGNNVLQQTATSTDARALAGTTTWTDYTVTARMRPMSFNGTDRYAALVARASSSTSYYYLALRNTNTAQLGRRSGGTFTALASVGLTVTAGSWFNLRIDLVGSTIRGYVGDTLVGTATDSTLGSGRIGVNTLNASAQVDDVTVTSPVGTGPSGGTSSSPTTPPSSGPPSIPPPSTGPPEA